MEPLTHFDGRHALFNHAILNTVSMGSRRIRRGPYSVSPRLALLDVSSSSGRIDDIDPADVGACTVVAVDDRVSTSSLAPAQLTSLFEAFQVWRLD
jgi:hypothetical protein